MPDSERKRTYRISEVGEAELTQALAERRVLCLHAGPRAYGAGEVWFTRGEAADGSPNPLEGILLAKPITADTLASWNDHSWDHEGEFWKWHDSFELTWPCQRMTPEQRVRFKQAIALMLGDLIEMLPFTLSASGVPYRELLRLYARDPSPELAQRVVICAERQGWKRFLFDSEQQWEQRGQIKAVDPYLREDLPRTLGEYIDYDRIAANGPRGRYDAWPAQDWLRKNLCFWVTETAWQIYREEEKPIPSLAEMPKPAVFTEFRAPTRQELEQRLSAAIGEMNPRQSALFQQYCVGELVRRLKLLPAISAELSALLKRTEGWTNAPQSESLIQSALLAEEAERIGGAALFGDLFRMKTLPEPVALASRMGEAAREMAVILFRAYTHGLEVRLDAEQEAAERAVDAMLEEQRRHIRNHILTR